MKKEEIKLRVGYPINLYVLGLLFVGLIFFFYGFPLWKFIFFTMVILLFFYVLFSRYVCCVMITGKYLKIKYFFWNKKVVIELKQIIKADYGSSFYNLTSDKGLGGVFSFPKYCYDELRLTTENGKETYFYINTLMFGFGKIYKHISRSIEQRQ